MKTNEAPEKIYLVIDPIWGSMSVNYNRNDTNNIEYIRKDAFIEKAEEFIYSALNDGIMGTANIEDFIRLFKKYMKGE